MVPEAKEHLERGLERYTSRDYLAAIKEFEDGYALEPRSEFLFAWAQAERLSGDCSSAIALYRKFLKYNPPTQQAEAAIQNLARCEAALATRPDETPDDAPTSPRRPGTAAPIPVAPAVLAAPVQAPVANAPQGPGPWYTDVWGGALTGVGLAAVAAGVVLFALSAKPDEAQAGQIGYDEYANRVDAAQSKRTMSYVTMGVGAALVGGGLARYMLRGPRAQQRPTVASAAPWWGDGGGGLVVAGEF
jgi:tetratricopeptide (TPR) repeat protein